MIDQLETERRRLIALSAQATRRGMRSLARYLRSHVQRIDDQLAVIEADESAAEAWS